MLNGWNLQDCILTDQLTESRIKLCIDRFDSGNYTRMQFLIAVIVITLVLIPNHCTPISLTPTKTNWSSWISRRLRSLRSTQCQQLAQINDVFKHFIFMKMFVL